MSGEVAQRRSGLSDPFVRGGAVGYEDFYRREVTGLVALARGLCPPAIAEDIAQEAMLVAYRRWPYVRDLEHPEAWVRRTCANMAVSQFRRRLAELRALSRTRSAAATATGPEYEAFWALVRTLPRRQAQVVALHYLYDLSVADVAATLEVSEGSVKVHLSRARESLSRRLGPAGEER
ncbi:RNA polymerase sigma factor [Pedococcus dokdonensis]|uniref:RNA polymerase sigma factor n=1 Tax=Pedococcus dokdonensis TaxID=443156 RepID=UPI0012FDF702|nr:sigma-70 family RNA polymerase sigma factor [Pedococcus dokdonensis]